MVNRFINNEQLIGRTVSAVRDTEDDRCQAIHFTDGTVCVLEAQRFYGFLEDWTAIVHWSSNEDATEPEDLRQMGLIPEYCWLHEHFIFE